MDGILDIFANADVVEYIAGLATAGVLFLISKIPSSKIRNILTKVIDKTDEELDKKK